MNGASSSTAAATAPARPRRLGPVVWVVGSLARHRDLLWQMVATDLRGRYVGSSLGVFWTVVHPLVMIVIYTVVFSQVMGARLPGTSDTYAYGIYLCAALLPWMGMQEIVTRSTTLFPDHANLVRKVAFPKSILYTYIGLAAAINVAIAAGIFMVVLVLARHPIGLAVLAWPLVVALQLALALGIGMILSVVHVFIRDTSQFVTVALQLVFWATPIVYVDSVLPAWLRAAQAWNPLWAFSTIHRGILLEGRWPDPLAVATLCALTAAVTAAGALTYRRFRADVLDEL